jgi:hypothetical protein
MPRRGEVPAEYGRGRRNARRRDTRAPYLSRETEKRRRFRLSASLGCAFVSAETRSRAVAERTRHTATPRATSRHCQVSICRARLRPNRRQSPGDSGTRHLGPSHEGAGAQEPVVDWPQQMPSDAEEIQDDALDRQELLGLSRRLEPSHLSLPLSGGWWETSARLLA